MRINLPLVLVLFGGLFVLWRYVKSQKPPSLPLTQPLPIAFSGTIPYWSYRLCRGLFWASCVCMAIALANPCLIRSDQKQPLLIGKSALPREGVAIYFLLDESGSMNEKVVVMDAAGKRETIRKIDLAKRAVRQFIEGAKGLNLPGRKNDLVGLLAFARAPEIVCPLTLNREEINRRLTAVEPVAESVRNGTAIGYAIFKAVNIIVATKFFAKRQEETKKKAYSIENQALIIITDGLQSPHPADKENHFRFMPPREAISYAKENGIRIFYVGIDPILAKKDFADDVQELKAGMQATGGDLFLADAAFPVEEIMTKIDQMEKSTLSPDLIFSQEVSREISLANMFIGAALVCLALAIILETTVGRCTP